MLELKGVLVNENLFLLVLAVVWIIGAIMQDFKRREVDNLWNFSLIFFALAYRGFVSIFIGDYWFFVNGLIGLGIFFVLANLFYYSRLFAGGDAKLMFALGPILPLSYNWLINFKFFGVYIILFFITGSAYALIYSFFMMMRNWKIFKKEIKKQWKSMRKLFFIAIIFASIWVIFSFIIFQPILILIALVVLLFPILFTYAKSIEEACMVKLVRPEQVTEGDWLYEDVLVGGKKIKSHWEGVNEKELALIKKKCKKKILIKEGVPFTPSFLFALIGLLIVVWKFGWLF